MIQGITWSPVIAVVQHSQGLIDALAYNTRGEEVLLTLAAMYVNLFLEIV